MKRSLWGVAVCLAMFPLGVRGQDACRERSAADAEAGWVAYGMNDMDEARTRFAAALALCAADHYARTGLGYVEFRVDSPDLARAHWREVLRAEPDNVDALTGIGLLAWREGDLEGVSETFQRVVDLVPDHRTALDYLDRVRTSVLGPPPERPELVLPDSVEVGARASGDRFEVHTPGGWRPFYIEGVNLGAALPGRFPSEFPDSATYARWIRRMAEMNANTVRVYTIHPPGFYEALLDWNTANSERPIRLIHGVWTELPPEDDFSAPDFELEFFTEIRRVVDVLHGRASIESRPGHAWGHYTADVTAWTLAYILGREWEPFSATAYDSLQGGASGYRGRFVTVEGGNALDTWMARAVEEMVRYETETYREQRPVAYTNWPTLDPLDHPSETTIAEEIAIREARGERLTYHPREYDNDGFSLDPSLVRPTSEFTAGTFASYHAYPYYPDFMILSERYARSASTMGPSRYFGYLEELKARHPDMPVVISEYGVPASLGNAHMQPQGWHHGGLTEDEMAAANRRLTLEIAEAGMAGGVLFAWIDEWFKRNWVVLEFELPGDRNRLWYNRLDAEQHYGMWALGAASPFSGSTPEERAGEWSGVAPLYDDPDLTVRATHDAAYLWLRIDAPKRTPGDTLLVGFDIVRSDAGDFRWPGRVGARLPVGLEFALVANGDEVRVVADPPSNPFRLVEVGEGAEGLEGRRTEFENPPAGLFHARVEQRFNFPYYTEPNEDGVYDSLRVVVNRRRFTRDSTEYLAAGYDRGVLPQGAAPDGFWEWSGDGQTLEVRIPWLLINVTDPSSQTVLQGPGEANARDAELGPDGRWRLRPGMAWPDSVFGDLGTERVADIGIIAEVRGGEGAVRVPAPDEPTARFSWPGWDEPHWVERARPTYRVMAEVFAELDPYLPLPAVQPTRRDEPGSGPSSEAVSPVDSLHAVADRAWNGGDTGEALALYDRILEENPDDPLALHRTGLIHAWSERYPEGIERLDRLVASSPGRHDVRVDRARILAWSGDTEAALDALDTVLEEAPHYAPALEARALFEAWAGRYEEALDSYDRLFAIAPDNVEARRQQAQVLAWSSDFGSSVSVYDSLLALQPEDMEARLGRARALAFSDRLDEAISEYDRVLALRPDHAEALVGKGRTLGWAGRLPEGETALREAVSRSESTDARVALSQNLRWQGRNARALQESRIAVDLDPTHAEAREQLRALEAVFQPTAWPTFSVESDSDDNVMRTSSIAGSWYPAPRLRLRADVYGKDLEQNALSRSTQGVNISGSYVLEPGWTLSAGFGGWHADGASGGTHATGQVGITSPGRYRHGGSLSFSTSRLDATAALASVGVRMHETTLTGRWQPSGAWRFDASAGFAVFNGSERNERVNGFASVARTLGGGFTLGVAGRAFGFSEDLQDGYFDPDFFGLAELTTRWLGRTGDWSLLAELAPGFQQVTTGGDPISTVRSSLRIAYDLGFGRELALSGGLSSSGVQSFSTGDSDYTYTALVLSAGWRF